jgi:hypothetical protein
MLYPFSFISGGAANTERTEAFLTATGITDATIISALNAMDNSLISAGLLPSGTGAGKIKALYPIVGGTASTHKFNFVDPRDLDVAFRLEFFGGWTHSANGIEGNGSNTYANTHYGLQVADTDNFFYSTYQRLDFGTTPSIATLPSSALFNFYTNFSGNMYARLFSNGGPHSVVPNAIGFFIGNRTASNILKTGRNNSINTYSDSSIYTDDTIVLGGNAGFGYSGNQFALFSFGESLSDSQMTSLYNLNLTFQTTLGRNV